MHQRSNIPEPDPPPSQPVHELFEQQASQTPNATAVICEDVHLSYQELNQRSNQLANHLRKLGVGSPSLVGIYMARSSEMVVGLLGILKAGGAIVPLDISDSPDALATAFKDGQTILMPQGGPEKIALPPSLRVVYLDTIPHILAQESKDNPSSLMTGNDLACIADTVESEEQSLNLVLSHQNVLDFFRQMDKRVGCQSTDVLLTGVNKFDSLSFLELLWVLTRGAKIVLLTKSSIEPLDARPKSQAANKGMQFSLFYFSSNEAEYTEDKYQLLLEGAKFADQHGFTAVWTPERHFHAFGGLYPNPSVLSSALAMVTKRIRLRAGSVVLPLHNPIRVAEEWSVIDNLSQGRVDVAFARGWNPNDFVLSPQNYANSVEVLFSGIQAVQKLWRGEAICVPNGVGKDTEIKIYPLPRQPELPVWVTCSGGRERFMEAGAFGANILTALLFQSVDELSEKIALYRNAREKHGHDPETGHVTLMLHTFVGEDLEVIRNKVRGPFTEYLKTSIDLWRHGSKKLDELTEKEQEDLLAYAFERYFQKSALFGTPSGCLQMVDDLKEIGVNEIACLIDFGVDVASVLESLHSLNTLRKRSNGISESSERQEALHLQAILEKHRVSLLHCTPDLIQELIAHPLVANAATSVRLLLVGEDGPAPQKSRVVQGLAVIMEEERRQWLYAGAEDKSALPNDGVSQADLSALPPEKKRALLAQLLEKKLSESKSSISSV